MKEKDKARAAREERLNAAKRLVRHFAAPPTQAAPKQPKHATRRMVQPVGMPAFVEATAGKKVAGA